MIGKVVRVVWEDSISLDQGAWMDIADVTTELNNQEALIHESVGYLIADNTDRIALAGSRSKDGLRVSNVIEIGRRAILDGPVTLTETKLVTTA
jgi:hypothetical protein